MMDTHNLDSPTGPVDLEIRISTPWGSQGQRLDFLLNSPSRVVGFHQEQIRGKEIQHPERFQKRLLEQLENLNRGLDVEGQPVLQDEVAAELASIGRDLYLSLFPREMRTIYREVRAKVGTLLITTDEPWIPWELLYPAESEQDDFLCMKHRMSRWFAGEVPLTSDLLARHLLCVEHGTPQDPERAQQQHRFFQDLEQRAPGFQASIHSDVGFRELTELLTEESFDFLHFTGHGEHDRERPGEAKICLEERAFRARHLSASAEKKLKHERPAVFFNSCELGQVDRSLTELDGWAQRWIRRCGCSSFLAPAWSVREPRARRFADHFYEHLLCGHTFGAAVQQSRRLLRSEYPGDTTWLAYRFYGSPNARAFFGGHGSPAAPRRHHAGTSTSEGPELPEKRISRAARPRPAAVPAPGGNKPSSSRSKTVLGVAAAVVVTAVVSWGLVQLYSPFDPNPQGSVPEKAERGLPSPEAPSGEEKSKTASPPPPRVAPPPPAREPQTTTPFEPMIAGKIAVIALDRASQLPDPRVAAAIRSALLDEAKGLTIEIPQLDSPTSKLLALGTLPARAPPGKSPWGAEYLLIATGSSESLPQTEPHIRSVALTLEAELVRTSDGEYVARGSETHTGRAVTFEAALTQAAGRCLQPIASHLNYGENS